MKNFTLLFAFILATFSWQVNAQTVEDNFDTYNDGDDPTGWTKYQTESDDPGFVVTASQANSAPNSLYHNDDNIAAASTSWIVAPVYISTGDDLLSFMYRQNYTASYYNYSGVWYSTTGADPINNPGDWTEIAEFNDTDQPYSEDAWTLFTHNFNISANTTIYIAFKYTGDWSHEFYIDDFKIEPTPQYFNPTFDLSLTNVDCANSQFSVVVNVTDLGGASEVSIDDDQGSATQQLASAGTVTFGPYASGTNVTFTVTNDTNNTYYSVDSISYTCPANNDDCFNADALTVYASGAGAGNEVSIDAANFNDSGVHPTCDNVGTNIDMWFTVTVPAGQTGFVVLYGGDKASNVEAAIWDACGGTEIACESPASNGYHLFDGLTGGQTYYLQLWLDSFNSGTFDVVVEELPTAPNCADNPVPADAATGVAVASGRLVTLSWDAPSSGPTPTEYKIEIGTTSGTYPIQGTTPNTTIDFTGVDENTTYYWKVTPINNGAEATGCTEWSFTTEQFTPPANDLCSGATALTVDANTCTTMTMGDNSFATDSGEVSPTCASYQGGDVWFAVTVPASGEISIETSTVTSSNVSDTGLAVYSGTCGSLTQIECNDDGGASFFSKIELTGQNPGDVLYVRVWEYGNNRFGQFNICAWDPSPVSIAENQIEGFTYYPNPVENVLNMTAQSDIEAIHITNISGQEVMSLQPGNTSVQVNMNNLPQGMYFVKVQVNNEVTAFKVVKK